MKILYFDCPTGISGDMCLASLIDLGVGVGRIKKELKKLHLSGYVIETSKQRRHAILGTRFCVKVKDRQRERTFRDIKTLIAKSGLSSEVKKLSIAIFKNLADAEGKVHNINADKVHFHEVGAVDSIVDIVGVCIALNELKADRIYSSPLPLGRGWVNTSHGMLPIPAPATMEIVKGIPVAPSDIDMELTTPTGAVIIKTLAAGFGQIPSMTVEGIGYGVGGKDFKELPNAMRAIYGTTSKEEKNLVVMETNIDDMNPQIAGYLMEKLLEAGALDAFFTPVQMKKNRPGIILTVLTEEHKKDELLKIIFKESTSIGVRMHCVERVCLQRKTLKVKTRYGVIAVKASLMDGSVVNIQPEYEDCKRIAKTKGIPIKDVMDEARERAKKGR